MFNTTKLAQSIHSTSAAPALGPSAEELLGAAGRLQVRADCGDAFAAKWAPVAYDIAGKVQRFGSYASTKQAEFAAKLVTWSAPQPAKSTDWGRPVPRLFDVLQRHAEFHAGELKIARRNQDSLCWLIWNDAVIGKIENGRAQVWARKAEAAGTTALAVLAIAEEFEADPLGTAKKYGRESGRCCSCGRDLTNEGSIEAGIGPICAQRFA